jgi:phosphoribosylaminoimidazole carboxylase PurE protein
MSTRSGPKVGILMGSDSDLEVMREAEKRLDSFGIAYETRIMSAHRTPEKAAEYAATAEKRGLELIICGAGAAAHLAGAIAANTTLPVIGSPIDSSSLKGLDALLAIVQMPAGIPVATMAIGKAGAANAGIFAAQIVARKDAKIAAKLAQSKKEMAAGCRRARSKTAKRKTEKPRI